MRLQTRTSWILWIALLVCIGCRPAARTGLADGPPSIGDAKVLPVFDPAAIANAGSSDGTLGHAVSGPPQPPAPPPLPAPAVVDYGPTAEAGSYPTIQIRFNRPMVALGEKTRVSAAEAGFTITPALVGYAYWAEPTRLVFEPKQPLPLASSWQVAFRKRIEAVDGPALDVDLAWSFATEPPRLSMATEYDDRMHGRSDHHWKAKVAVDTNQDLALAQLRRHTRAHARDTNGGVTDIDIAIRELPRDKSGYRPHAFEIRPKTRWPADAEVVIEVDAALTGKAGPRPMATPFAFSFNTAAGVESLGVSCVEGQYDDGCEIGPVLVHFTAPLSRAQAKHVRISPAPKGLDVLAVHDRPGTGYGALMVWGDFQRGVDYELEIDEQLRDVYGQPLLGPVSESFHFVEPPPSLMLDEQRGTFQPSRGAKLGVETRHVEQLRVRVARLDAATHESLLRAKLDHWPGNVVATHDDRITLPDIGRWGWSSFELDLRPYSGTGTGTGTATLLVEVSPAQMLARAAGRSVPQPRYALVQLSELGVSAVSSLPGGVVRVAKLADDTPVGGAEIELISEGEGGKRVRVGNTDVDGLLRLPESTELPPDTLLRVHSGNDSLLVPAHSLRLSTASDGSLRTGEHVQATVMTERPLYKPGERVRVMGWAAISTPYELSSLRRVPSKSEVIVELHDVHDELIATRTVRTKDHGKFWATLDIPETVALGEVRVSTTLLGSQHDTTLRVEDFATPEFEVAASSSRSDIHGGESVTISVDASYFFGARVPIQRARTVDDCDEIDFRPPGLEPSFAVAPRRSMYRGYGRIGQAPGLVALPPTAARGHLEYDLKLRSGPVAQTLRCKHSVAIADASEREIGAEATIWVHPPFYLASRAPHSLDAGQDAEIELRTMDFDGTPLSVDEIVVTLERHWSEPEYRNKRFAGWRERSSKLPPCKVRSDGQAACRFAKLEHGSYAITVASKRGDDPPIIEDWLWVREADGYRPYVPPTKLELELDRAKLDVGDKLRARVRAPWQTGRGLVLLDKGGVHELRSFELDGGQAELEYVVEDAWIPGVRLHALAVEPGTANKLPRLRRASAELAVATDSRTLTVSVEIPSEAQTGERLPITVRVHDSAGHGVGGHVSVWAVDEAVLSLAPLRLPDFVAGFARGASSPVSFVDSYDALLLPYVSQADDYRPRAFQVGWASGVGGLGLYGSGAGGGGAGYGTIGLGNTGTIGHGGGSGMPATRSKFSSAPIFIGDAVVGSDGVARLHGELPDNLTTFRVTAVASASLAPSLATPPRDGKSVEARFGSGDARVRVTRPLVVRAALPRILRPGDVAEFGVLVDNRRGQAGTVEIDVALLDADGVLELLGQPHASAAIDVGDQLRVPFSVRALTTGSPQLEVRARLQASGAETIGDALRLPLPVEPERTLTDRVAVYGSLDDDGAALLPFAIPADADPGFGGLSISVGTTLLGNLEDAVAYLVRYPHGCVEQTSSALLPLIPLGRLAAQGYPLGIEDVGAHVAHGIARLRSMQLAGGGFAYWPGGTEPSPYGSAYATWVLSRAHAAGYGVPSSMLYDALDYVHTRVDEWAAHTAPGVEHDIEAALMLATLADQQLAPLPAIDALYARRQSLPVFAQAQLLLAIDATNADDPRRTELLRELLSVVDEREAVAKVETDTRWTWYWDSDVRSSAIVLMALLHVDPNHPLASKLTRGLLEQRRGGRWSNTQENAWALLALADYAAVYEADEPNFDGRVWLGRSMLGSVHAQGREFGFDDAFTAMDALLGASTTQDALILERAGVGRMYYRVGLEWASTAPDKPAKAEGIRIERTLRDAAGPVGVDQAVHAGDLLAIDVELEVPAALDHVAIQIPLPAGLEAVNLGLGKGTAAMKLSGARGHWVSHQELRRDRAVLFADHIEPGRYTSTVFLRATTPGDYVMPAGHAEMMYYPEVYGRTTARRLLVR